MLAPRVAVRGWCVLTLSYLIVTMTYQQFVVATDSLKSNAPEGKPTTTKKWTRGKPFLRSNQHTAACKRLSFDEMLDGACIQR